MPLLTNILLGVLGGQLLTRAVFDHIWYPYLTADSATLKSKVSSLERLDSTFFYRRLSRQPAYFTYVTYAVTGLILLSLVGQTVVSAKNRASNILALASFSSSIGVYVWRAVPLLAAIAGPRAKVDRESAWLRDLAFWQACMAFGWFLTLILQTSVSENEQAVVPSSGAKRRKKD